ncbi:MAG: ATP-dependent sacrificial sulfur transferase LarE [Spirochaetaceae bacterium]|nr:ATP-dependent sacrificial sulfur transferase LarE [Spirochaetaceae bacterium]
MNDNVSLDEKYDKLIGFIGGVNSAAVAFSGGVDSSFLCHAAVAALGGKALAVTIVSPMLPQSEIDCAKRIASLTGIRHILVNEDQIDEEVAANPHDRCYYCKKIEFSKIIETARENGAERVFDGSNTDDLNDYRPGLRALSELKVSSPLREAGLNKAEIRELSKRFGLPTWNKPAFACLASRIPYGERIDRRKLSRIEKAEDLLRAEGFVQFRVRSHGDIARIEVAREERRHFFNEETLDRIASGIKGLGFLYAAFELEGYAMGSLNRARETSL